MFSSGKNAVKYSTVVSMIYTGKRIKIIWQRESGEGKIFLLDTTGIRLENGVISIVWLLVL